MAYHHSTGGAAAAAVAAAATSTTDVCLVPLPYRTQVLDLIAFGLTFKIYSVSRGCRDLTGS